MGMLLLFGGKIKIYFRIDHKKVEKSPIAWKAERKIGLLKGLFKIYFYSESCAQFSLIQRVFLHPSFPSSVIN